MAIETTNGKDGSTTTSQTVQVTNEDKDGKKDTTTINQTCTTSGDSTSCATTSTSGGGYMDPDADMNVVVLTPADMERILIVKTGSDTTPGPGTLVLEGTPRDPHATGTIILLDPEQSAEGMQVLTTLPVVRGATPEQDPRLPSVLEGLLPKP